MSTATDVEARKAEDQRDSRVARAASDEFEELVGIADRANGEVEAWRDEVSVSIGRASALTRLKETQIRYFEELGVLHPKKVSQQSGATRSYTLADLRQLHVLAELLRRGRRPAEAAELVRKYAAQIETRIGPSISNVHERERRAQVDSFLLARLMSQLIDATQAELDGDEETPRPEGRAHVVGLIFPLHGELAAGADLTYDEVQRIGRALASNPAGSLVAVNLTGTSSFGPSPLPNSPPVARDDSTVLLYSRDPWELPHAGAYQYAVHVPRESAERAVLVVLEPGAASVPVRIEPSEVARAELFERVVVLCYSLIERYRSNGSSLHYRYSTDGFRDEDAREMFEPMLQTICDLVFPGDDESMAALFIPNNLDNPQTLQTFAQFRYEHLVPTARIRLGDRPQGLSGRAFVRRQPFFSFDACKDRRIEFKYEEGAQTAMAIPLNVGRPLPPNGVLYLASRRPSTGIDKTAAYIALLMGIIVGELIERWWVARLRRVQMFQLHKDIDKIVEWIGTLSEDGPGLHDAIERLAQAGRSQAADAAGAASVTLVVIDIDKYLVVQNTSGELIPMAAQEHVRRAIQKVLPGTPMYWFKNDHVLLLLEQTTAHQAVQLVDRIGQQVRLLPLSISGPVDERPSLTISAAIRDLTYQQLRDMAASDEQLREDLRAMIVDMRRKTKDTVSTTWILSQRRGWQLAE